jgi:hypothetical protein
MPAPGRSIRRPPHHTNTCSGAAHTRRPHSAPSTARSISLVPLCSSSRCSTTPTSSSTRARPTRIGRRRGAHPRPGVPERCWHVRSTASHRWSGRRPVAASSQDVADAGRQTGSSRTPPGLCRPGSPGEWGAVQRHRPRPAANSSEPRRGRGSRSSKPAATYSPRPLRAKYHRR